MAQSVKIAGALFSNVPSIQVPDENDVFHPFVDTSPTTATAADVASGKIFFAADGTQTSGTASGGSATIVPKTITANGTYNASADSADGYDPVIVNVSGGGGSSDIAVVFIDYDGTVLHSYTAQDFADLSALPANPSHSGLVAQGWNYTKAQIETELTNKPDDIVYVGQNYITASGKTEIDIVLTEPRLTPYLGVAVNGTVTVDWGDGATETVTGTSLLTRKDPYHTYSSGGAYTITVVADSGQYTFVASNTRRLLDGGFTIANYQRVYSAAVKAVRLGNINSIGSDWFSGCASLASVTIPSSVAGIGSSAFANCYALPSITIPSGVTSIGNYTFQYCYSLASVAIPSSVTGIATTSFYGCSSLKSIAIPSGVTSIGTNAFQSCYSLTSITIPSGVTSIATYLLYYCSSLKSITIPSGVTSIGTNAFQNCYSLTSITIPNSVTSIGTTAFQNCYALKSITIPSGVTSIGNYTFSGCSSIASFTIPSGVTSIGNSAFANCFALKSITIPSGVTSIGNSAFSTCYGLTSITIPDSVTSIGTNAFQNCYALTSITIPSGVTSIGTSTFSSCYALASITIPSGVTSIGNNAFASCLGVEEYHVKPITPPTLSNTNVFSGIRSGVIIYVPSGSLSAYQSAAYWSTYASYMQEEPA